MTLTDFRNAVHRRWRDLLLAQLDSQGREIAARILMLPVGRSHIPRALGRLHAALAGADQAVARARQWRSLAYGHEDRGPTPPGMPG